MLGGNYLPKFKQQLLFMLGLPFQGKHTKHMDMQIQTIKKKKINLLTLFTDYPLKHISQYLHFNDVRKEYLQDVLSDCISMKHHITGSITEAHHDENVVKTNQTRTVVMTHQAPFPKHRFDGTILESPRWQGWSLQWCR